MFSRGEIYLAKLYPSKGHEVGKSRPVLILQTNLLNHIGHTTIIILPLTSQIIDDTYPLRFMVSKREDLKVDSDVLCDQIRSIDINRLHTQKLTTLSSNEMLKIEQQLELILDFS